MSDLDRPDLIGRPGLVSRRRMLGLLGAGTGVSLLAACGPSGSPVTGGGPASGGTPVFGGTVVIAQDSDPVAMDPQISIGLPTAQVIEFTYEALVAYDERTQLVPSLATSWTVSPDGLTYTFNLRKGVKWHNGREFVASDVVFWWQRVIDPKINTQQRPKYLVIKSVDVIDNYTVKFNLSQPWADLLGEMATFRPGLIPNKETVEQFGDLKTHAIGTGPYKFVEFKAGDFIRLKRNEDYWGTKPYADEILLKIMVDESQRIAALRTGQVHIGALSPVGGRTLAGDPNVTVLNDPLCLVRLVQMRAQQVGAAPEPLADVRVRKALDMSIDRQEMIAKVMLGQAVLSGPTPTGYGDWSLPEDKLPAYFKKPDIAGAKQLLAQAGYPNGFKTTIRVGSTAGVGAGTEPAAICVILQEQWKAIGVDLQIQQVEATAATGQTVYNANYNMGTTNFTFYASPDTFLGNWMPERGIVTPPTVEGLKNPAIMDKLAKAAATLDQGVRKQLYTDATVAFMEMVPILCLYSINQIIGVSKQLQGYKTSFTGRRPFVTKAWLKQ